MTKFWVIESRVMARPVPKAFGASRVPEVAHNVAIGVEDANGWYGCFGKIPLPPRLAQQVFRCEG
jgi:hypothetical protein